MMPALLRRASFWEVPITAAHAGAMAGMLAIFWSLHAARRRFWWLRSLSIRGSRRT
jgi:hypothetical protein